MKRLIYQVYVGARSNLYDWCTESVKAYAESINADYILQTMPKLFIKPDPFTTNRSEGASRLGYLPIFEKENAFEYFPEYDQIAIIDSDIYIRENAPNVFDEIGDNEFAGVYEREMPVTPEYANKIRNYSRMQYSSLDGQSGMDFDFDHPNGGAFMNMGMMVMNKISVKHLDYKFNALYTAIPNEYLKQSHFIHFFLKDKLPNRGENVEELKRIV